MYIHPFYSHPAHAEGFVTFAKSNVKALLTAYGHQKMLLRPTGLGYGALPRLLRTAPQCSLPFKKGSRTASLNFVSLAVRQEERRCLPSCWQVFSVRKHQQVQVVFAHANLHLQVCPIDFFSAPCVGRDGCVDIYLSRYTI